MYISSIMAQMLEKVPVLFSICNVCKRFSNGTEALNTISFEIYERELLVLSGPNGSGKSVLMKMLVNLLEPTHGTILYKDKPIKSWGTAINREVGLVFQDAEAQIIGDTVEEDVCFGPENLGFKGTELEKRVTRALAAVGLLHKRASRPATLSGGEQRRLAIAGILAMGSSTIIMDEPYANLDWEGVRLVNESIKSLHAQGYTLIVVTHELEKIAGAAGRLGILYKGSLKALGSPQEVFALPVTEWGIRNPRVNYHSIADCIW